MTHFDSHLNNYVYHSYLVKGGGGGGSDHRYQVTPLYALYEIFIFPSSFFEKKPKLMAPSPNKVSCIISFH